jgi:nucleoside-diphosphate-sugar epimerase
MKTVLVTGATGFIGRPTLAPLLNSGYEVHAAAIDAPPTASGDVHWHTTDLLDAASVERLIAKLKPSHLLHFAWYAVPGKYWTAPENVRWVQASLEILQAFARHGGQRVVMAGTCAEYDWNHGYCSETVTPLAPATLYGHCKHALQLVLGAFAEQARLSAAWGRVFFLYGPREYPSRLVPSVITSLLRGEPARCSHGNQIRDFLYVDDVAAAFVALLDSPVTGAVNIASGVPMALKDIIYAIADQLQRRDLVRLGAIAASPNEPELLAASVSRLRNEVGWQPQRDLLAGLNLTIDWWKKQP